MQSGIEEMREDLKVTWEMVVTKFEDLVKFAASQQVRNYGSDTMVSAEDLYQEGMIKLYDCWMIWCVDKNKGMDEFGPIFKTSLFRVVRNKGKKASKSVFIDIEDASHTLMDENADDTVERLHQTEGILKLKNMLNSEIAVRILEELAEPSPRTLWEVWADLKRKETLKSQGKRVNIPKDNTVRMKHIIRSLGITGKQYDVAMLEIREKSREALQG